MNAPELPTVEHVPNVATFKAPPQRPSRSFGTTASRIDKLRIVGPEADYDPQIAYVTSVISGWTYSDPDVMSRQLAFYGLPECTVHRFQVVNRAMLIVAAVYFVRSADGRIGLLAFRGTVPNDFINWLTDTNTELRSFNLGRVHTGFFQNLQPLWNDIVEQLESAVSENQDPTRAPLENLYITGHSLGAAMAVLAAARLFTNDYQRFQQLVRGVYTFGQPAAGDRDFGEHYGKRFKLYRHVYRQDIVPHLPPRSVGEYCHFGRVFLAGTHGWQSSDKPGGKLTALVSLASIAAVFDFFSRRVVLLRRLQLPYSMDDHGPEAYIRTSRLSLG